MIFSVLLLHCQVNLEGMHALVELLVVHVHERELARLEENQAVGETVKENFFVFLVCSVVLETWDSLPGLREGVGVEWSLDLLRKLVNN